MEQLDTTSFLKESIESGKHYVAVAIDHTQWFRDILDSSGVVYTIDDIARDVVIDGKTYLTRIFDLGEVSMYSVLAKS